MVLLRSRGPILSITFFVAAVVLGCSSRPDTDDERLGPGPHPRSRSGGGPADLGTPIKPGTATIKGRITVKDAPDSSQLKQLNQAFVANIEKNASPADRPHCLNVGDHKDQLHEQDWKIGPDDGLGQVLVYLRPPQDSYFAVNPDDPRVVKASMNPAIIDQPHCVYVPHVIQLLPSYRDLKGTVVKCQDLVIRNTARIGHNVKFPSGQNYPLSSGGDEKTIETLKPEYTPYGISCSIHPWMSASILVLDHPYSAITNDKGEYEIKNAPVGKLRLIVWHSKSGFVTNNKARGEEIELKKDETVDKNFEVPFRQ